MELEGFLFYAFALLIAITVHEAAHAWMAYKLGDYTAKYEGRVTLNPLAHLDPLGTIMIFIAHFGWGKPVPYNPYHLKNPQRDSALIAIAGPMANFITALLFSLPLTYLNFSFFGSFGLLVAGLVEATVWLNVILMVFNILPIAPLDGSKLLAVFIPERYHAQYQDYLSYGPYILIGLILLESFGFQILGYILTPLTTIVFSIIQFTTTLG